MVICDLCIEVSFPFNRIGKSWGLQRLICSTSNRLNPGLLILNLVEYLTTIYLWMLKYFSKSWFFFSPRKLGIFHHTCNWITFVMLYLEICTMANSVSQMLYYVFTNCNPSHHSLKRATQKVNNFAWLFQAIFHLSNNIGYRFNFFLWK